MLPLIGPDPKDREHAKRFLRDLSAGRYDDTYHYYDVLAADWCYLNGQLNARPRRPACPFVRVRKRRVRNAYSMFLGSHVKALASSALRALLPEIVRVCLPK